MYVKLIKYTENPERVIALAARLCYSKSKIDDLENELSESYARNLVKKIISLGHYSVLEHVNFTFGIGGISRVTSHQLVRHRIASYSQQSQRYVDYKNLEVVIPPSIMDHREALERFKEAVDILEELYRWMIEKEIPVEDSRYILPNATTTSIVVTMNGRELDHFFTLRCCRRAQWEIRAMAKKMLREVRGVAPTLFRASGPSCLEGPCSEGEFTCGKRDEVKVEFENL